MKNSRGYRCTAAYALWGSRHPRRLYVASVLCAGVTTEGSHGHRVARPRPAPACRRGPGARACARHAVRELGLREAGRGQGFCAADVARAETAVPRAASRTPRLTAPGAAREAEPTQRRAPAPATPNVPAGCGGRQGDRTRSPNGPGLQTDPLASRERPGQRLRFTGMEGRPPGGRALFGETRRVNGGHCSG